MAVYLAAILAENQSCTDDRENAKKENHLLLIELETLQLAPGKVLLVEARTGWQRKYWHQWASERQYKYHFPIITTHFETNYIYQCSICNKCNYEDDMITGKDYSDLEDGRVIGSIIRCPGKAKDEGDDCWGLVDDGDNKNSDVKYRPVFNALYITNNETVPRFPKNVACRRNKVKYTTCDPMTRDSFLQDTHSVLSYAIVDMCIDEESTRSL